MDNLIFTKQYERELRTAFHNKDKKVFFLLLASFSRNPSHLKLLENFNETNIAKLKKARWCAEYIRPFIKKVCFVYDKPLSLKYIRLKRWEEIPLPDDLNLCSLNYLSWLNDNLLNENPTARLKEPKTFDVDDVDSTLSFYSDALTEYLFDSKGK